MFKLIFYLVTVIYSLSFCVNNNNNLIGGENLIKSDTGILRTDNVGNILGGDLSDWDFDQNHYNYFLKYKDYFYRPFFIGEPHTLGLPNSIFSEVEIDNVIITWFTGREIDSKEFEIERKRNSDTTWKRVGSVLAEGNSNSQINYKFIDRGLEEGVYSYRLKLYSRNGEYEYFNMESLVVFIKSYGQFQFYPAYPNPVSDTVNISFYLPKEEQVSIYYISSKNKIYILDSYKQKMGYYRFTIDKKSLGFENEIKRLYIECESCNKEKNFGDVQF